MATTEAIRRKIAANVYRIENINEVLQNHRKKFNSNVWNFMCAIYTDEDALIETHVCCRLCKCVFKYQVTADASKRASTSNLFKHLQLCKAKDAKGGEKSKNSRISLCL